MMWKATQMKIYDTEEPHLCPFGLPNQNALYHNRIFAEESNTAYGKALPCSPPRTILLHPASSHIGLTPRIWTLLQDYTLNKIWTWTNDGHRKKKTPCQTPLSPDLSNQRNSPDSRTLQTMNHTPVHALQHLIPTTTALKSTASYQYSFT